MRPLPQIIILLILASTVGLMGADLSTTNVSTLSAKPKSGMEFLTNLPPIKLIAFRYERAGQPAGDMDGKGGIQGSDFWLARWQRTTVNGKPTAKLTRTVSGRWGTTNWSLAGNIIQTSVVPYKSGGTTNPVVQAVESSLDQLSSAIHFGLGGIEPDSIQAISESEFNAQHRSGKIMCRFEYAESGRPERLRYNVKNIRVVHDFMYGTNLPLSFFPSEISVSTLSAGKDGAKSVQPVYRYQISSLVLSESPLPSEMFLPERWIFRKPDYEKIFTNNAWIVLKEGKKISTTLGSTRRAAEMREMRERRKPFIRISVFLAMLGAIVVGIWWVKKAKNKTTQQHT